MLQLGATRSNIMQLEATSMRVATVTTLINRTYRARIVTNPVSNLSICESPVVEDQNGPGLIHRVCTATISLEIIARLAMHDMMLY